MAYLEEAFAEAHKQLQAREVDVNVSYVLRADLKKEKLPGFVYAALDWLIVAEVPKATEAPDQAAE